MPNKRLERTPFTCLFTPIEFFWADHFYSMKIDRHQFMAGEFYQTAVPSRLMDIYMTQKHPGLEAEILEEVHLATGEPGETVAMTVLRVHLDKAKSLGAV